MIKPNVILFDLGKVLVEFDWDIAARKMAQRSHQSSDEILVWLKSSPVMNQYEGGKMNCQEFFAQAKLATGYTGTFSDFQEDFGNIFSPMPQMIGLLEKVHASGMPIGVLSNTNDLAITHIRKYYPFFSKFRWEFLSYKLGVMKPQPAIYQAAEIATGCSGSQILYIDDARPNIDGAVLRQWQTIHHVSVPETIGMVEQLLR